MFFLDSGIQIRETDGLYRIGDQPITKLHITAPPHLKTRFQASTGGDLLNEILQVVKVLPKVVEATVINRAVRLSVQRLQHMHSDYCWDLNETKRGIMNVLMKHSPTWLNARRAPELGPQKNRLDNKGDIVPH